MAATVTPPWATNNQRLRSLDDPQWPTPLQPYVRARGGDVVSSIGLDVLGYPPIMADTSREYKAVIDAIEATDVTTNTLTITGREAERKAS